MSDVQIKSPESGDVRWAVNQDFAWLPAVDPDFSAGRMGGLRRALLKNLAVPQSYRKLSFGRILMVNGERAGYLFARELAPALHIDTLYISPAERRKGYATRLLEAAEQYTVKQGNRYLSAGVTPANKEAQGFFGAMGFRPHREEVFETTKEWTIPAGAEEAGIRELRAAETLLAYDRWMERSLRIADNWAAPYLLAAHLRIGWRGAARHWICLLDGKEAGYLRLAGLNGRYQGFFALEVDYFSHPAQLAWLKLAVEAYPGGLQALTVDFAADAHLKAAGELLRSHGFESTPRGRYLTIKPLDKNPA